LQLHGCVRVSMYLDVLHIVANTLQKTCISEIQGGKEDKEAALKSLLVSSFVITY